MSAMLATLAAPAFAQDAEGAVEEGARRLNTVKVEATRREGVTVQDVPIAVSAYDAAILEDTGFDNVNDLEQLSPSVQITQTTGSASGTSISLRGIGTGSNNPGFEPSVGIVVDGVVRTRTGAGISELPEVASLEVLRGPQGTLFGRNTSSGVVSVNTPKPSQEGDRKASVSVGNYDAFSTQFSATGGIGGNWAARIDAKYRERNGYIDDVNYDQAHNDIKRFIVRGQIAYEGANTDLRIIADYLETDEQCCTAVNVSADPGIAAAINAGAGLNGLTGIYAGDPFDYKVATTPDRGLDDSIDDWGVSVQWDQDIGDLNFTSITAYRDWQAFRDQDIDFSGLDRAYRDGYEISDATFTQELRLQGDVGIVDWLVGGFYMNQQVDLHETILFGDDNAFYVDALLNGSTLGNAALGPLSATGVQMFGSLGAGVPSIQALLNPALAGTFVPSTPSGGGAIDDFDVSTNAFALFTHNEFAFTDKLTGTLGLRYNYETKEINETLVSNTPTCDYLNSDPTGLALLNNVLQGPFSGIGLLSCNPAVDTGVDGQFEDDRSDSVLTGTAKIGYAITDDINVYGSYTRGFKSGGYNLDRAAISSPTFTAGAVPSASQQSFDREEVDAFELGWKTQFADGRVTWNGAVYYQKIDGFQENIFTGTNFRAFNTEAEVQGVEMDFGFNPVDGLIIQGGMAYTDAERTEGIVAPDGAGGTILLAEPGELGNVPDWVLTGSGTYTFPMGSYLEGIANLNVRWQSEDDPNSNPALIAAGLTNDAYALVGARLGVSGGDGDWQISLFGENLTDEEYYLTGFPVPEQPDVVAGYPGTPRFYGVEGKVRF